MAEEIGNGKQAKGTKRIPPKKTKKKRESSSNKRG